MHNKFTQRLIRRVALPMAEPSQVESRVRAILQSQRIRNMATRKNMTIAILLAAGVCVPLASLRPVAQAQAPNPEAKTATQSDPAAISLLRQMGNAYKTLQTYSGTETADGGGAMGMPYRLQMAYARPGKVALTHTRTFGRQTVVHREFLDGKTLTETSSDDAPGHYTRMTQPEKNYSLWEEAFIINCDVKFPITMELLEDGYDLLKNIIQTPGTRITLGPPQQLDGVAVDTIVLTGKNDTGVMQIGHQDHLLRRFTEMDGSQENEPPRTMTQTFTQVRANPPLAVSTFVYTPPVGAVAVDVDPGGAHADPAAVALLTQMYAASAALRSFSCERDIAEKNVDALGKPYSFPRSQTTIAIENPGRVAMVRHSSEGEAREVSDGTNVYVTTTESSGPTQALPGRYLKLAVGPDAPNRVIWLSRFGNLPQYVPDSDFMPNIILGGQSMPADLYDWKMGQPGVVDGEPVDTVTLQRGDPSGRVYDLLALAISRRDHLLRQVSEYQDPHQPLSRRVETYNNIRKNPVLPASLFVFTPPPGSTPVSVSDDLFATRQEH